MHEIEHSLRLDRRTRGILIDVEVRRECAHKSVDVPFHQCHDKVEIAGHARFAVIPKRKRARQHEGNIGCAQPLADYSENIEFLGHDEESKRLATAPQPLAGHRHQGSFDDSIPTTLRIAPAALDFYLSTSACNYLIYPHKLGKVLAR